MAGLSPLYITKHSGAQSAPLWQTAGCTIKEDGEEAGISVLVASDQRKDLRLILTWCQFPFLPDKREIV